MLFISSTASLFIKSLTHLCISLAMHYLFFHSLIHLSVHPFIYSSINYKSICPFTQLFIHPFIHIYSFIYPCTCLIPSYCTLFFTLIHSFFTSYSVLIFKFIHSFNQSCIKFLIVIVFFNYSFIHQQYFSFTRSSSVQYPYLCIYFWSVHPSVHPFIHPFIIDVSINTSSHLPVEWVFHIWYWRAAVSVLLSCCPRYQRSPRPPAGHCRRCGRGQTHWPAVCPPPQTTPHQPTGWYFRQMEKVRLSCCIVWFHWYASVCHTQKQKLIDRFTCPEAVEVSFEDCTVRKLCLAMAERPQRSRFSSTVDDMADCLQQLIKKRTPGRAADFWN